MNILTENDLERFWGKVDKNNSNHFYHGERCWEWVGGKVFYGYGAFSVAGKTYRAHRISWIISFGEIQNNLQVLHHCDNPPCVNPAHLFLGSHKNNMEDKVIKGRQWGTKPMLPWHGMRKLTDEQIDEIGRRCKEGESPYELAKEFGISQAAVRRFADYN